LLIPFIWRGTRPENRVYGVYVPAGDRRQVMDHADQPQTPAAVLARWHHDHEKVRVWYIDRGAPDDRPIVSGQKIILGPDYMTIQTGERERPIPPSPYPAYYL